MLPEIFRCFLVNKDDQGNVTAEVVQRPVSDLPTDELLVRVAYSSLNYKDALAATGHSAVAKRFPHVPGVDAAGTIVRGGAGDTPDGTAVLIHGFQLGVERWGGFAEYVSVPHEWIVPLPETMSLRESMVLGTAGFTAAMCIDALQKHDVNPDAGEVVVTGASGGVGSMAVAILAKLGYRVVAVSGKAFASQYLKKLGAARIAGREEFDDRTTRPMLSGRWAGAVDTVGGNILATLIRSTKRFGCIAACGLTAGAELPMTVYPFILRGITLAGIDTVWCPMPLRRELWQRLAGAWKPTDLDAMTTEIQLDQLPEKVDTILKGGITGRVVVKV